MKPVRLFVIFCVAGLALVAGAWVCGVRFANEAVGRAVTAAAVICFCSAIVAVVPLVVVSRRHSEYVVQAGMAAIPIRLFLTLGVGLGFPHWSDVQESVYTTALVGFYLAFLAAETFLIVRMVNRRWSNDVDRAR